MKTSRLAIKRTLQEKWNKRELLKHHQRIRLVRSSNYSKSPLQHKHLQQNKKKAQLVEGKLYTERFTEIERENRLLLEKMAKLYEPNSRSVSQLKPTYRKNSLNHVQRKRDLAKIASENQALLKRLQELPSVIRLATQRRRSAKFLGAYGSRPTTTGQRRPECYSQRSSSQSRQQPTDRSCSSYRTYLVFEQTALVQGRKLMVEVEERRGIASIMVTDLGKPAKYELQLKLEELKHVLGGELDYSKLLRMLSIENNQLVLNTTS